VIGIALPSFKGTEFASEMNFWEPLMMQAQFGGSAEWFKNDGGGDLSVLGRLKSAVKRPQAKAQLDILVQRQAPPNKRPNERGIFNIVSEIEGRQHGFFGSLKLIAALTLGVSGLVLLVACANVANLLLARATARSREIVIRLALGAGRWRIIRQLLMESLLLALLGGGLGLLVALWGADLLRAGSPFTIDLQLAIVDFSPDWRVLSWTLAVSLLTGLLFGLAPAWQAARTDLLPVLKNEEGGSGRGARRLSPRNLLVVAQLAISVVVLVCAGLFVKGLYKAQTADPEFQPENLLSVRLNPGLAGYDEARAKVFFTELVRQVETLPGVRTASLASAPPLGLGDMMIGDGVIKEGNAPSSPSPVEGFGPGNMTRRKLVGPKYFETTGTPLVLGRGFTERDKEKAPRVVIINQALARRLYGSEQQALGKRLSLDAPQAAWMEIVGVAQDGHLQEPRPTLFQPLLQGQDHTQMTLVGPANLGMTLLVRATAASEFKAIADGLRREARKLDARVPVFQLTLGEDHIRPILRGHGFYAGLSTTLAVIAAALASLGLYGVMAYAVSLRTKEIGIRMALGAQQTDVIGLVMRQGLFITLLGVASGLVAAFVLTQVVLSLFYGASTTDPLTFGVIALLLTCVALLACYLPARRATKVDPLIALRHE
jgi:predicted permease